MYTLVYICVLIVHFCVCFQGEKWAWPPRDAVDEEKWSTGITVRKDQNPAFHHEQGWYSVQWKTGGYQTPEARDQEAKTRKEHPQQNRL